MFAWLRRDFKKLGPGLITGASDDDPSGIATYSQAGAGFGFSTLWSILLTLPLMIAIQEMCARIAIVTKRGLVANMRRRHSRPFVFWVVLSLLVANVINIGADLGMMASAVQLLVPGPFFGILLIVGLLTLALQIFIPYTQYAKYLKWLTLSLLAYVGVAFALEIDWLNALWSTVLPQGSWSKKYLLILVALLGTTISPYLYFWQANQEVEESHEEVGVYGKNNHSLWRKLKAMRFDVSVGMIFSNVVAWFIIVSAAAVLDGRTYVEITTADQMAQILEPLAGRLTSILFALGIIGTGLLTTPILSSTAAYALSELFGFKEGLSRTFLQAKFFYGLIIAATVVGALMNMVGISPVRGLIYAAILNGLIAPPLIYMIVRLGGDERLMGKQRNSRLSSFFGWMTFGVMTGAIVGWVIVTFVDF